MRKNKNNTIINVLICIALFLFLVAMIFLKKSDAVPLIVFYIAILSCVFSAIIMQIKEIVGKPEKTKREKKDD